MLISKIPITFQQDWSDLIAKYDHLKQLLNKNPNVKSKWIDAYKAERYDFGASGSYVLFDTNTIMPGSASSLNGSMVEKLLPWIPKLKQDMFSLKIASIGFQGNSGPVERHVDNKEDVLAGHCKLNYIIDNYDVVTYAERDGVVENYPSVKDTGWLIDTTAEHWVEGQGQRYIFQICFDEEFSKVLEWFKQHPNLIYK